MILDAAKETSDFGDQTRSIHWLYAFGWLNVMRFQCSVTGSLKASCFFMLLFFYNSLPVYNFLLSSRLVSNIISYKAFLDPLRHSYFFHCDFTFICSYFYWSMSYNILISIHVFSRYPPTRCLIFPCIHSTAHHAWDTLGAH